MRPYKQATDEEKHGIRRVIAELLEVRPEVVLAFLFGSFVDEPWFRDIDIAVLVDPQRVPPDEEFGWAAEMATALELRIGHPVDVVVLNRAPVALRFRAVRGEILVNKDPELCDRLIETTCKEYADFEPFLRATVRDLLNGP
ncbi:MAG: nucleotidyltransferase domain-containing protein [Clostridia bacterium]|nr:nucleotidyltransferase domain-containing protein [Clostridia bacterium]